MPLFSFTLDHFDITDTRSHHEDTDYISFALRVGNKIPTPIFKALGNLNNGQFPLGLEFEAVDVEPGETVIFSYLIFNAGQCPASLVQSTLATLGNRLAVVPNLNLPALGSSVIIVADQFEDELSPIVESQCDGLVAAEQASLTYAQLLQQASKQPAYLNQSTSHRGPGAPNGCNSKPSAYVVHWNVMQVVLVPSVLNQNLDFKGAFDILAAHHLGAQQQQQGGNPVHNQGGPSSPKGNLVTEQNPKPNKYVGIYSPVTVYTQLTVQ